MVRRQYAAGSAFRLVKISQGLLIIPLLRRNTGQTAQGIEVRECIYLNSVALFKFSEPERPFKNNSRASSFLPASNMASPMLMLARARSPVVLSG